MSNFWGAHHKGRGRGPLDTSSRGSGDAGDNGRGRNGAKRSGVPLEGLPSSHSISKHKKESDLSQF